jgi:spore maturation protein CgeB
MLKDRLNGRQLRVAIVADPLTRACLQPECELSDVTPLNYQEVLAGFNPDFLFFESVWHGYEDSWKFKVASYPWYRFRSNNAVAKLTRYARRLGIPTVFWCKEDGIHFQRFINSAKHFDHVLTVDANCVVRYKKVLGERVSVNVLPFPVQPRFHSFTGFDFKYRGATFLGSYSHHIHGVRRAWQDMAFTSAIQSGLGLTIFDRNSNRHSGIYRYPHLPGASVLPALTHEQTGKAYKEFVVSLNVNTVTDSPSMYSRRLVEILACGGIAVTSPAQSVDLLFKDFCHVVSSPEEAFSLFERLAAVGPDERDLARARAGSEYVLSEHTWAKRLQQIVDWLGLQGRK